MEDKLRAIGLAAAMTACAVTAVHASGPHGGAEGAPLSWPLIDDPMPFELERLVPQKAGEPSFEEQVVEIVNQERWNNGQLPPLKHNSLLDASSETHSSNMAGRNFFAHCDVDTGDSAADRMADVGYVGFWGENISAGRSSPASVMDAWMNSSGHRANILRTTFREIGVGYVLDTVDTGNVRFDLNGDCVVESSGNGPYFHYWTQNFGSRSSVYPVVINREAVMTTVRDVSLYLYGTGPAIDMRIRNEDGVWTAWLPFSADVNWTLSPGSGTKTVTVEIRDSVMTVLSHSDTILLDQGDIVFEDGFESGAASFWSFTSP